MDKFTFALNKYLDIIQTMRFLCGLFALCFFLSCAPTEAVVSRIFVTNRLGHSVSVIERSSLQVIATISVSDNPTGITTSPDGETFWVANTEMVGQNWTQNWQK